MWDIFCVILGLMAISIPWIVGAWIVDKILEKVY